MKKLIIAEKPSVSKNIADALGNARRQNGYFECENYIITWAFGHLLQLYDVKDYDSSLKGWRLENFPYIPNHFCYKIKADSKDRNKTDSGAKKQMELISALMKRDDVEGIIAATDFDREGQVISDEILDYLKVEKPVERILLNEWTKDEVMKGLASLCPNSQMQSLQDAGIGRQWADWLIGINLTSVATVKFRFSDKVKVLNIGRVLLPTLKIIYDRDKEIENFESSKYYKMLVTFLTANEKEIEFTYYEEKDDKLDEKFEEKEYLDDLVIKIEHIKAYITEKEVEQKKEYCPYLFNLSNLQGYITSKYKGFTSDKVLKIAQNLYEKKLTTYPRTASVVLEESLKDRTLKVFETHKSGHPLEAQMKFHTSKRLFDSSKVESHSAIIPTYMKAGKLTEDESIVYNAIRNRFLMQFLPVSLVEETSLTAKADATTEVKGIFMTKGKILIEQGWKAIEKIDTQEVLLPPVEEGDELTETRAIVNEIIRKPPKRHTEKTLLRVMETCGKSFEENDSDEMMMAILSGFSIGTPATRAETIKKLKDVGYVAMKGKNLYCTDLGCMMVEKFPVHELFDLEFTGRLEKTLSDIEHKKFEKKEFMSLIIEFVRKSVADIKDSITFGPMPVLEKTDNVVGVCPECGCPVVETDRAFGCSNWKNGCKFTIWKRDRFIEGLGKKVSPEMVKILLESGRVGFRGLVGKSGKKFAAYFHYVKDEKTGRYSWNMEFIDSYKK